MLSEAVNERFEIAARLGAGSFGTVYEAFDRYRNRPVALKVLERVEADTVVRFKREFRYLAEIRHPNLASMYELVVADKQWILVMELIHGTELLEHLAALELQHAFLDGRVPTQTDFDGEATMNLGSKDRLKPFAVSDVYIDHVRDTFGQIALAIVALHASGVVHRDIKPSNIMITSEGRVVLLDFGLVIPHAYDDSLDRQSVVGTPGFMSPEQVVADKVTTASDWYGFGALLYQALTGQPPFTGQTALEVVERQMRSDPPRASHIVSGVPEDLSALAFDCLQRDPAARPSDFAVLERIGTQASPERIFRVRERPRFFVGRGRELRTLRAHVDSLQPDASRIVLLHGSPGAGKSAIIDRFLDDLRTSRTALILGGRCQAWESLPLNAIDAIVDSLTRELRRNPSDAVAQAMRTSLAVTQLFPVLAAAAPPDIGDQRVSMPTTGERLIARGATELRAILSAAAGDRPIVMVLDDAQWGDYQSAQVFRRMLEGDARNPILLILAYRSEDWRTSLLLQALRGMRVKRNEIHVYDLSRTATERVLKESVGRGGRKLVDRVYRQTGGNPMLIELVRDFISDVRDDALLGRAINARLERLSAASRLLFGFLLSSENAVADETAERALELFEIEEPLRSLARERLIRLRRTGDLREIDVYHPRMREVLRRRR